MAKRANYNNHCFISDLPIHLLHEIFFKLPIKFVLRCKSVSPAWKNLISNPNFSANYAINSPFTSILHCFDRDSHDSVPCIIDLLEIPENGDSIRSSIVLRLPYGFHRSPLYFVGSCNGFLCMRLSLGWLDYFYVINPILGDRIELPKHRKEGWVDDFKFGFSPITNELKVLRILFKSSTERNLSECDILTVGVDDKWRRLPDSFTYVPFRYDFVALNGFFHWISARKFPEAITTFDLAEEKFGQIPVPSMVVSGPVYLAALGNQLGLVDISLRSQISIWTLKKDSIVETWTKVVVRSSWLPSEVRTSHPIRVSALRNGDVLLQYPTNYLISCNIEQKKCSKIEVHGVEKLTSHSILDFAPNFLSPAEWVTKGHGNTLNVQSEYFTNDFFMQ